MPKRLSEDKSHNASFIVSENNGGHSRGAGSTFQISGPDRVYKPGEILGRSNFNVWLHWNPNAADGTEVASGICVEPQRTTTGGAGKELSLLVRDAEVNDLELTWDAAVTPNQAQKDQAIIELGQLGIIVREIQSA